MELLRASVHITIPSLDSHVTISLTFRKNLLEADTEGLHGYFCGDNEMLMRILPRSPAVGHTKHERIVRVHG